MRTLATVIGLALLGACSVGPDFHAPSPPTIERYIAPGPTDPRYTQAPVPSDWWHAFGSGTLDARVARAFEHNPTLQSAQASLRAARELALAQRGALFPSIGVGADASRARDPVDVLSPTLTNGNAVYSLYGARVDVGFVPDLFGGQRRALEGAGAQEDVARAERDAAYLAVAGNVVTTSIQLAALDQAVGALTQAVEAERELLALTQRRMTLGDASAGDVATAEGALAAAEAQLAPVVRARDVNRDLLAVLLGQLPTDGPTEALSLEDVALPATLTTGVPSQLVARRPDVAIAEANLHAATAAVGVARAQLLPQIVLGGSLGSTATRFGDLGRSYSRFWSGGATLSQSIFQGGALVHQERAARAQLDRAGADYRNAVLTAFQNVADAVRTLEADEAAGEAARRAADAAARTRALTEKAEHVGAANRLDALTALAAERSAAAIRAVAEGAVRSDVAALYAAVAGPVDPTTIAATH
jgi:NodT family efflux transporter outer membrane factor (OMF) lipoprotein